jgi:phenylalanyl-tRNA synthetase alpha chain
MGAAMDDLKQKYLSQIANAADEAALEDIRLAAVGKKGEVALKMRELGKMTPEERQTAGPALNALKDEINSALAAKKAALGDAALDERLRAEWLDVTLPVRTQRVGSIHPVSQVTEELTAIFAEMGFSVAEGPRIDTDWYNFDALNIPGHHPARAEMDTFYMHRAEGDDRPPHVLRTHTSPVQIRTMEKEGAPLRIICPGGVYRADYDQTHTPMFHQVEGLAIHKDISMANLKWVLEEFFAAFFEIDGIKTRFRASHFPSPSRPPRWISSVHGWMASCGLVRATVGWKCWALAWCIPRCWRRAGLILTSGRVLPLAWGSTGLRC